MTAVKLPVAVAGPGAKKAKPKCQYCGKDQHPFPVGNGNNVGSSAALSKNMYPQNSHTNHAWYSGGRSLQAHHLVCSEALDDDEWFDICGDFGYDINCKENGVMLPNAMRLACQVHAPLHRGPHSAGEAAFLSYPDKVTELTQKIKDRAVNGDFCSNPHGLIQELNDTSKSILKKVDGFTYTLTADGKDYQAGRNGCAGVTSVTDKPSRKCPSQRRHGLKHGGTVIPPKSAALKIGK